MPILSHIFKKKDKSAPQRQPKQHESKRNTHTEQQQDEREKATKKVTKSVASKSKSKGASAIKKERAYGAYNVIVQPHISEKSVSGTAEGRYVFEVYPNVNKNSIAQAIETLYGVKVKRVNTISVKGKRKRYQNKQGVTPRYNKAIVTLKKGQEIEVLPQ